MRWAWLGVLFAGTISAAAVEPIGLGRKPAIRVAKPTKKDAAKVYAVRLAAFSRHPIMGEKYAAALEKIGVDGTLEALTAPFKTTLVIDGEGDELANGAASSSQDRPALGVATIWFDYLPKDLVHPHLHNPGVRHVPHAAYLTGVAVHPEHEGKGIATALVGKGLALLKDPKLENHYWDWFLFTGENWPARRIYENRFQFVVESPPLGEGEGWPEPILLMRRSLPGGFAATELEPGWFNYERRVMRTIMSERERSLYKAMLSLRPRMKRDAKADKLMRYFHAQVLRQNHDVSRRFAQITRGEIPVMDRVVDMMRPYDSAMMNDTLTFLEAAGVRGYELLELLETAKGPEVLAEILGKTAPSRVERWRKNRTSLAFQW